MDGSPTISLSTTADWAASLGMGAALVGGVFEKGTSYIGTSAYCESLLGTTSHFRRVAGRLAQWRGLSLFAPLGMVAMLYNVVRAGNRVMDRKSEDLFQDKMMCIGALLGGVSLLSTANPRLRGIAALLGLGLDIVDLYHMRSQWQEDQMSTSQCFLQGGLTLVFGLDQQSRQSLKGFLPQSFRFQNFKTPNIRVYSQKGIMTEADHQEYQRSMKADSGNQGPIRVCDFDGVDISFIARNGIVDMRDIRLIHTLSEDAASEKIAEKLVLMRQILAAEKGEHPFSWRSRGDEIMAKMTWGDKCSPNDPIFVGRYNGEGPWLLLNGHRRLSTLALLAARGEIPVSWLRRIPVECREIWDPKDIDKITAHAQLKQSEVLAEVVVGGRSSAEAPLASLAKADEQIEDWHLYEVDPEILSLRLGEQFSRLHEIGALRVSQDELDDFLIDETLRRWDGGDQYGSSFAPSLNSRLQTEADLNEKVWARLSSEPAKMLPFLRDMHEFDEERVCAYAGEILARADVSLDVKIGFLNALPETALREEDIFLQLKDLASQTPQATRFRIIQVLDGHSNEEESVRIGLAMAAVEDDVDLKQLIRKTLGEILARVEKAGPMLRDPITPGVWRDLAGYFETCSEFNLCDRALRVAAGENI